MSGPVKGHAPIGFAIPAKRRDISRLNADAMAGLECEWSPAVAAPELSGGMIPFEGVGESDRPLLFFLIGNCAKIGCDLPDWATDSDFRKRGRPLAAFLRRREESGWAACIGKTA